MRINKRAIVFFALATFFAVAATYTARGLFDAPAATAHVELIIGIGPLRNQLQRRRSRKRRIQALVAARVRSRPPGPTQLIQRQVCRDAIEPSREPRLGSITIARRKDPQEGFLHEFLRGPRVPKHSIQIVEERASPAFE